MPEAPVTLEVLGERISSVSVLVSQGFEDIQRQLNAVGDLPVKVEGVTRDFESFQKLYMARHQALIERVEDLEECTQRTQEWRRGSLPMIILTVVMAIVALASLTASIFH